MTRGRGRAAWRLVAWCLLGFVVALAPLAAQQAGEVLRNVQVVAMSKAGISPQVIIFKIETSTTQFDTSPEALAVLKSSGVHESVVETMARIGGSGAPNARPAPARGATTRPESTKPVLVVEAFTVRSGISWPYDMRQLQAQTVATFSGRPALRDRFEVVNQKPLTSRAVYTLSGEVTAWTSGNRATRMVVGMGAGRESADIRFWLTDGAGQKVFEHTDTIRAEFVGNAMAGSVGQLSQPFSSKLADRVQEARLNVR